MYSHQADGTKYPDEVILLNNPDFISALWPVLLAKFLNLVPEMLLLSIGQKLS